MSGPLHGVKVIEMAGLGPAPFAAMMLADLGAEVITVDRLSTGQEDPATVSAQLLRRGKQSIALDLKQSASVEVVLRLVESAEVIVEGFRPGVMERLGLGPDVCLVRNPRLVYARMTGWGQHGPLSQAAGHDINYISLSGALHAIGTAEQPIVPLNLVGDFGGGAMLLAVGVLSAVIHARTSGKGQVVDAAMTDGSALLMSMMYGFKAEGHWKDERAANMLDGGAHFYGTYRCADDKWISIGSIEPQFSALLVEKTGMQDVDVANQRNPATWVDMKQRLVEVFARRTRNEWCALMEATDVCFAPVLAMEEAPAHPHNLARQTFCEVAGVVQPAPAPRFSQTPACIDHAPVARGSDTSKILERLGLSEKEIDALHRIGAIG